MLPREIILPYEYLSFRYSEATLKEYIAYLEIIIIGINFTMRNLFSFLKIKVFIRGPISNHYQAAVHLNIIT